MADVGKILRALGIAIGGTGRAIQGARDREEDKKQRKLIEQQTQALIDESKQRTEASRQTQARADTTQTREAVERLGERISVEDPETVAKVGQTERIFGGVNIPGLPGTPRPIHATEGISLGSAEIAAAGRTEKPSAPSISTKELFTQAAAAAKGKIKRRDLLFDTEVRLTVAKRAAELGFRNPETGEIHFQQANDYLATLRDLTLDQAMADLALSKLRAEDIGLNIQLSRKKLDALDPAKRQEAQAEMLGRILGRAKASVRQDPKSKLQMREAIQRSVLVEIATQAEFPLLQGLAVDMGTRLDLTYDLNEAELEDLGGDQGVLNEIFGISPASVGAGFGPAGARPGAAEAILGKIRPGLSTGLSTIRGEGR